jgi:hypothetical protein
MYAVTIEPLNAIVFLAVPPGDGPWSVVEGVELDLPSNYDSRFGIAARVWSQITP